MQVMYAASISLNDSIPKSFQFVFAADSLQTQGSRILTVMRKTGNFWAGSDFRYTINRPNATILLYHGETGVLQKVFTIVCLTPGHLAFQFNETSKSTPEKEVKMEYRFLVDYTWGNSQGQ